MGGILSLRCLFIHFLCTVTEFSAGALLIGMKFYMAVHGCQLGVIRRDVLIAEAFVSYSGTLAPRTERQSARMSKKLKKGGL